jgi:hypothetical protein
MKPWRAREAELILAGARPDGSLFHRAAEAALAEQSPPATTASRSSSRDGSWCGLSRSPQPARPSACPRFRHPPSPPFPEMSSMPEIALTQAPAHVRHGSNIGQPLTRRDGILKVTGAARYAADNIRPGCSTRFWR